MYRTFLSLSANFQILTHINFRRPRYYKKMFFHRNSCCLYVFLSYIDMIIEAESRLQNGRVNSNLRTSFLVWNFVLSLLLAAGLDLPLGKQKILVLPERTRMCQKISYPGSYSVLRSLLNHGAWSSDFFGENLTKMTFNHSKVLRKRKLFLPIDEIWSHVQ
jgi:hypothetical protein